MEQNSRKKMPDVRRMKMSAVLLAMAVFTVVALSYAWFVNARTSSVDNADLGVEDVRCLCVRASSEDQWSTSLDLNIDGVVLEPMTTEDGMVFKQAVTGVDTMPSASVGSGQVFKKVVTGLESVGQPDSKSFVQDIQLMYQEDVNVRVSPSCSFLNAQSLESAQTAPALRMAVYENTGTEARPSYTLRTIWKAGDEPESFTSLKKNQPGYFRIRIWAEGTDPACVNSSCGEQILLKLQFAAGE